MSFIIILLLTNLLFSQGADDIFTKSLGVVEENDRKLELLSGEFKLKVLTIYDLPVRKGNYEFLYDVKFEKGEIKERKLISHSEKIDSQSLSMAKRIERVRTGESIKIKNLIFPFVRFLENSSEKKLNFKLRGVEKCRGKDCYVLLVNFKAKNDSVSSEGDGVLWLEKESYFPLRCEYEIVYQSKRTGKNQNKQFIDISKHENLYFLARNEIQFSPKALFVKLGTVKIIYEPGKLTFKKINSTRSL